jgi:hypothetical protein
VEKSRERLFLVPDNRYADAYAEVYAEAERARDSLRAGVEAIVEIAELNPVDAREGLWRLSRWRGRSWPHRSRGCGSACPS